MAHKIILFDLDGTLIDPRVGKTKSSQYALKKFGIDEDLNNLLRFIGPPLNKSFQEYYGFSEEKSMEAVAYYREYYIPKGMYENTIYEGIPELLKKLKKAHKKLFVVTSQPTEFAEKILKHHNLETFFQQTVGCKMDLSNADKTSLVNETLLLLPKAQKEDFVMIGDREHDIIGAKVNGIDSIGVTYGFGSLDEITAINPTSIAESVEDLEKYLL